MAEELRAFLASAGLSKELGGKAQALLDASGANDLSDLVELVEELSDLRNLYDAGFLVLHVKKLFRALVAEKERRGPGGGGGRAEFRSLGTDLTMAPVAADPAFATPKAKPLAQDSDHVGPAASSSLTGATSSAETQVAADPERRGSAAAAKSGLAPHGDEVIPVPAAPLKGPARATIPPKSSGCGETGDPRKPSTGGPSLKKSASPPSTKAVVATVEPTAPKFVRAVVIAPEGTAGAAAASSEPAATRRSLPQRSARGTRSKSPQSSRNGLGGRGASNAASSSSGRFRAASEPPKKRSAAPSERKPIFLRNPDERLEEKRSSEWQPQATPKTFDFYEAFRDAPALGPPGRMSPTASEALQAGLGREAALRMARAAAERAAKEMEQQAARMNPFAAEQRARVAATQRQQVQQTASRRPDVTDRLLEFSWDRETLTAVKGKWQLSSSPISELSEEDFRQAFLAALKALCDRVPVQKVPSVQRWLLHDPRPRSMTQKGRALEPHALVVVHTSQDAETIRQIHRWHQQDPVSTPFLEIHGQVLKLGSPSLKFLRSSATSSSQEDQQQQQADS